VAEIGEHSDRQLHFCWHVIDQHNVGRLGCRGVLMAVYDLLISAEFRAAFKAWINSLITMGLAR
jgi:hypothetical protein